MEVSGATPGEPFWLVLGQSFNSGWSASIDGEGIGDPELVDGFANGWQVVPDADSFVVDLRFAPQTTRRPRHRRVGAGRSGVPPADHPSAPTRDHRPVGPGRALLEGARLPLRRRPPHHAHGGADRAGRRPARVRRRRPGGGTAHRRGGRPGGAPRDVPPLAAAREPARPRASPPSTCSTSRCATAPAPGFEWPIEVDRVHPFGWLAILLVVTDVIVDRVWQARRTDT